MPYPLFSLIMSLTSGVLTDGGGIRGMSQLLIIREIMHRKMVDANEERKLDGRELLTSLPKPCECFDLIGGTGTGGCVGSYISMSASLIGYLFYALQDNCPDAWASSDGYRRCNQLV